MLLQHVLSAALVAACSGAVARRIEEAGVAADCGEGDTATNTVADLCRSLTENGSTIGVEIQAEEIAAKDTTYFG